MSKKKVVLFVQYNGGDEKVGRACNHQRLLRTTTQTGEEENDKLEMGTFKLHLWREIHINLQVHPLLNTTLHSEAAFDTGIDFEGRSWNLFGRILMLLAKK